MTRVLKQSTSADVRVGPFVAIADGITPVTTVTLGAADEAEALRAGTATLDISGATWAAVTGSRGWYTLTLSTTATNTVGELVVVVQDDSVCLPVFATFQVVEEAVYDALFAASAAGYATAGSLSTVDTNVSAIKTKTDALTFTVANVVDSNIQRVNDVVVTGTGTVGDEWGP